MKKRVMIVAAILVCLILGVILSLLLVKENKEGAEFASSNNIQVTEFSIADRTTLKKDSSIYIGNNVKELENNFYDIKILNTQSGIVVYLNKLWYETYGEDYIQDEYLARICRELSSRLNVGNETEQFEYVLYKYIKDNYVKVRQNEPVENIATDILNLSFELEDNIVKLIIQRGS